MYPISPSNPKENLPNLFFFYPLFEFCDTIFRSKSHKYNNLSGSPDTLMEDINELEEKLVELQHEHKDLDDIIDRLQESAAVDLFQMKRLQKKKLMLKDQIQKIKSEIIPDIIA